MASEFIFYKLNPTVLQQLKLYDLPLPVRKEMKAEIFRGESVDLAQLLEELQIFLDEHPDFDAHYRDTISTLAYVAGIQAGKEGYHEVAAHILDMGLWRKPEDIPLRINYAIALHSLGRTDEALSQYEIIMADPDVKPSLPLWIMAARIYADKGEYAKAHKLLKECAPLLPQEDSFWDFLSDMEEKAGLTRPEETRMSPKMERLPSEIDAEGKTAARSTETKPAGKPPLTCPKCMAEYATGDSFCGNCGQDLKTAARACPHCGVTLHPDDAFCSNCGKKCAI